MLFHTDEHMASCAEDVRRTACNLPIPDEASDAIKTGAKHIQAQV